MMRCVQVAIAAWALTSVPAQAQQAAAPVASGDFLNAFARSRSPIDAATFRLRLAGVVADLGRGEGSCYIEDGPWGFGTAYDYGVEGGVQCPAVTSVPELLGPEKVEFATPIPALTLNVGRTWAQLFKAKSAEEFSAALPTIEVLRNKLVTLTYADGQTESLLFNTEVPAEETNNRRQFVRILLADEIVGETDRDMEWRVFWVGEEAYIAMNATQLVRLRVRLSPAGTQVHARRAGQDGGDDWREAFQVPGYDTDWRTVGDDWFLYRKRDDHMTGSWWLPPQGLTFLFKLDVAP
jgi:hypothetical protein